MTQDSSEKNNFLDPKKYNTIHISAEDAVDSENKKSELSDTLIDLLKNPEHKEFRHETLGLLKKNPIGLELLMQAIKDKKITTGKQYLISACWEAGMDTGKYLSDFVSIVIENNFLEAMEALTVIEDMQHITDQKEILENIKKIENAIAIYKEKEKLFLLQTTLEKLKDFIG